MCVSCVISTLREICANRANEEIIRLASAALMAYLMGHLAVTVAIVRGIRTTAGHDGLYEMAAFWCDAVLKSTRGIIPGGIVYLSWEDVVTGRVAAADEVPPAVRWSGQFLAARAAADEDASRALFAVIDRERSEEHLGTLLDALSHQAKSSGAA